MMSYDLFFRTDDNIRFPEQERDPEPFGFADEEAFRPSEDCEPATFWDRLKRRLRQ